jgi:hypothetical protein
VTVQALVDGTYTPVKREFMAGDKFSETRAAASVCCFPCRLLSCRRPLRPTVVRAAYAASCGATLRWNRGLEVDGKWEGGTWELTLEGGSVLAVDTRDGSGDWCPWPPGFCSGTWALTAVDGVEQTGGVLVVRGCGARSVFLPATVLGCVAFVVSRRASRAGVGT